MNFFVLARWIINEFEKGITKDSIFFLNFYSDNIISVDTYFEDLRYDEIEQIPVYENGL